MEIELHQVEPRYEKLRRKNAGKERRLAASLIALGQLQPVVVVRDAVAGRYVLVDGYKRVRALRRLKLDTVSATTWDLGELEAVLLERVMRASEADSALEQGFLLCELNERFVLSQQDLARRFDKSASWVSTRLGLVRALPEQVRERVQSGAIPAHAAAKYLVPMARAKRGDCVRLVTALDGHTPSTRDIAFLYTAWVDGNDKSREVLLSQPEIVLRAREEARPHQALSGKGSAKTLEADLSILLGASRRARVKIERGHCTTEQPNGGQGLVNLARQARWECDALFELLLHRLASTVLADGGVVAVEVSDTTADMTRRDAEVGDAH